MRSSSYERTADKRQVRGCVSLASAPHARCTVQQMASNRLRIRMDHERREASQESECPHISYGGGRVGWRVALTHYGCSHWALQTKRNELTRDTTIHHGRQGVISNKQICLELALNKWPALSLSIIVHCAPTAAVHRFAHGFTSPESTEQQAALRCHHVARYGPGGVRRARSGSSPRRRPQAAAAPGAG
jgi:hypothetical protein